MTVGNPDAQPTDDRAAYLLRWPPEIRDQVREYGGRMGIPMQSVIMIFINDGLRRAGFPGAAGSAHSDLRGD